MVFPAVVVFGIGLAVTVAPLTATAMGAASPEHAGIASAVNNVVARAAALVAVAVLPLVAGIAGGAALQPAHFAAGFRAAVIIAGIICAVGGVLAAVTIRNPPSEQHLVTHHMRNWHCAIDGAPLQAAVSPAASDGGAQR
jgi:MFS family permease